MIQLFATLQTLGATLHDRREHLARKLKEEDGFISVEYVLLGALILAAVVVLGGIIVSKLNEKGGQIGNL